MCLISRADCEQRISFNLLRLVNVQVVETVVTTKLQTVDILWPKLNEYDVNQKLSEMCMPPAVLKYGDLRCI